jgi:hypothetical protein
MRRIKGSHQDGDGLGDQDDWKFMGVFQGGRILLTGTGRSSVVKAGVHCGGEPLYYRPEVRAALVRVVKTYVSARDPDGEHTMKGGRHA